MSNRVSNEQQVQNNSKPKSSKMALLKGVWKVITTVVRILDLICNFIQWLEGDDE